MKSQEHPFTPGWKNEFCPVINIELMWKLVLGKLDCLVQLLFRSGCSRYLSCWQRWKENIWGAKRTFCCQLAPFSSFLAHTVTFVSTVTCNMRNKYFICFFFSISFELSFPFCSKTITCLIAQWNLQQNIDLGRLSSIDFYSLDLKSSPLKYLPWKVWSPSYRSCENLFMKTKVF